MIAAVAAGMAACDKNEIYLGSADDSSIVSPDGNVVYVTDGNGYRNVGYVEFSGDYTLDLYLKTTKKISGNVTATLTYDLSVLEEYNKSNGTEVAAFPQSHIELANGGSFTLPEGSISSAALSVKLTSDGSLNPTETYAIPFSVKAEGAQLSKGSTSYVILVRDCTAFPGAEKYFEGKPGMKICAVVEVNGANPLNCLGFTLKETGKQFFDMVVLFSSNINYDKSTGRLYISHNENVQALLDNREKYIKPLQERGIKVILSILGNHDISGVSTLGPELSKAFAKEVKQQCDAYQLDGVFLDDEYTDYDAAASGQIPGFTEQSYLGASRLAYDIKQIQPDRLVLIYRWDAYNKGVEVNGVQPGEFMDYVFNNYWVTSNPVDAFPGLKQSQAGTGSWSVTTDSQCIPSNDSWTERFSLTGMREQGYGALMIYNFNTDPSSWLTKYLLKDMEGTSKAFWNQTLEYDGSWYPKDF